MYPPSRWWLDFGLSRWEARKCNSECLGLHSWCVTYNICLQTALIFEMVRVSQRVPRALFLRAHMYRELMLKALAMPWRLSLWNAGAGADSVWLRWARWCGLIQPRAKWRLDKFDADILPSPSQLCYFSFFFRLFFSFPILGVYWLNIFPTLVIPLYIPSRFLPNSYNQYWCIYYFLKLICLAFFF